LRGLPLWGEGVVRFRGKRREPVQEESNSLLGGLTRKDPKITRRGYKEGRSKKEAAYRRFRKGKTLLDGAAICLE